MTTYQQKLAIDILNHACEVGQEGQCVSIQSAGHTGIPFYATLTIGIDGSIERKYRNAYGFTENSAIENLYRIVTGKAIDPVVEETVQE